MPSSAEYESNVCKCFTVSEQLLISYLRLDGWQVEIKNEWKEEKMVYLIANKTKKKKKENKRKKKKTEKRKKQKKKKKKEKYLLWQIYN